MDRFPRDGRWWPPITLLAVATTGCWAAWMGWDVHHDVDPVTGHTSGPYQPWQVIGCVVCLVAVAAAAGRWLPFVVIVVTMPIAFSTAFSVSASFYDNGDGLFVIGAFMLFVAVGLGAVVVAGIGELCWTDWWDRRHPDQKATARDTH